MVDGMRGKLHNALLELELREQDMSRLTTRNAYLEGELKKLEQHHTNSLKEIVVLKQQAAQSARMPKRKEQQGTAVTGCVSSPLGYRAFRFGRATKPTRLIPRFSAIISVQAEKSSNAWTRLV
jgi:hypothetical protein